VIDAFDAEQYERWVLDGGSRHDIPEQQAFDAELYEQMVIEGAISGNAEDGFEALDLCRSALDARRFSPQLSNYLRDRLTAVIQGIPTDKALLIARDRGRPSDGLPEWQLHLGAFAALLAHRGFEPEQIASAMCKQRRAVHKKSLAPREAHRIRLTCMPMLALAQQQPSGQERLVRLAGPYGKVLDVIQEYVFLFYVLLVVFSPVGEIG